ncbi:MAG: spermidine/putrescine ABC transporter substrate-binding protein, partial [Anaerolineae bacterium]|nr:spermidine/putrescine ABC transporter substrate-binding protein [Anaerolineae bacterium]
LDKSKLVALSYFDPNYLNLSFDPGNEYTVPYQAGTDAIIVNTDKVKEPVTAFADLWRPEFARRIVSVDDSRTVIGITLLTLGYDINTKDPAQLEEARVKLAQLIPNIKVFDSDSPKTALIGGDVDLGIVWTGEAALAHQENPAFEYIYPVEGPILWQDNWAIPVNAPHPDAAYAWLNYTLQPDLFWLTLRDFPYNNPHKAALEWARTNQPELYETYMGSPITNIPPEVLKRGHRVEDVGEATPLYDRIWTEVKGQ